MLKDKIEEIDGINFIDVGASGGLDPRWHFIADKVNFVGFEPRKDDCDKLSEGTWPYRSARFLPYAIAGENATLPLYVTKSPHCTSLRKPNKPWLDRFTFHDLFTVEETLEMDCVTLDHLVETEGLRGDIMKMDIQGMEGPAMAAANSLFEELVCIETESGFTRNYEEETVFWEIGNLMEEKGFIMYELFLNRMGRDNPQATKGKTQPLWCQAIWMCDIIGRGEIPSERKAKAAILIASLLEYKDYAQELQTYCMDHGVLTDEFVSFE